MQAASTTMLRNVAGFIRRSIAARAAGSREWQMSLETAEARADASFSARLLAALVAPVLDFRHDMAPGCSVGSQFVRVETIIEVIRLDGGVLRIAHELGTGRPAS
jgi:hypothetical protein